MQSNKNINDKLYDQFFLEQTFNSSNLKAQAKTDMQWLVSKIDIDKNAKIFDIGCGTGRHLRALLDLNFANAHGVDFSEDCVKMSKQICPEIEGKITCEDVLLKTNAKFDLVLCLGATFGYSETEAQNIAYLQKISEFVADDGYLVIDYLNLNTANSFYSKRKNFWTENAEMYILDERELIDSSLKSKKIYINKLDGSIRKYSDSVFCFLPDNIKNKIQSVDSQLKFKYEFSGFSDVAFDNDKTFLPVLIYKKS